MKTLYIIGSLRNSRVAEVGNMLRKERYEAFDDWHGAGPEADDCWMKYEKARGRSFRQALQGHAASNTFAFDKRHLDRSDGGVLVMPAGKSGHLEIGYLVGQGKPTFILFDKEPERWDVMVKFATHVSFEIEELRMQIFQELG